MSKLIALIVGAWTMYCAMIGSYDGAVTILAVYVLTVTLDPFELHQHKKSRQHRNC
ncbi:hypothetical protein [Limosilactobacillus pontis]|uniref:hypothetical protein n=1 Tax=Limosilactobacillus pontis TaxID=35787 RepID=UPI00241EDFCE|nr:hypothetical protein [Limosilactobacillus pontis]